MRPLKPGERQMLGCLWELLRRRRVGLAVAGTLSVLVPEDPCSGTRLLRCGSLTAASEMETLGTRRFLNPFPAQMTQCPGAGRGRSHFTKSQDMKSHFINSSPGDSQAYRGEYPVP